MNLLTTSDDKLTRTRQDIDNELRRRTLVQTDKCDAAAIIYGNELAKRALIVAAAGGHSILFIGPPNCGKTMIRAVALELVLSDTFEARPCPCGYRSHRNKPCRCSVKQIERHCRKLPIAQIIVEMAEPSTRQIGVVGTMLGDMKRQIESQSKYTNCELDDSCRILLKGVIAELGIDMVVQRQIVNVARTIANLERSKRIATAHLCEAINYRPLGR